MAATNTDRLYVVRPSGIHGKGVFARKTIRKGSRIIEYRGVRTTMELVNEQPDSDPDNPYHTFIFELSDGTVIDAGVRGSAARWVNHSCAPNCETIEEDGRVYIHARQSIRAGEELTYDYRLTLDDRITAKVRKAYACGCGAPRCRGTMLIKQRPNRS